MFIKTSRCKGKATTSMSKFVLSDFKEWNGSIWMMWLQRVKMGGIPGELVVNWEQSGIKSVPDQLNCQHRSIPLA